jgi:predicted ribosomally synthesized peptide with nif11-like leader
VAKGLPHGVVQHSPSKYNKGGNNMSIESAQAFLERMKTDEEFAKKVSECKDAESGVAFVNEEWFDFTKEEVHGLQSELTDEELEGVAGGRWFAINELNFL